MDSLSAQTEMASKKNINEFLSYIREDDFKAARQSLKQHPELAHEVCGATPAKYEGQTLLQIAVRNPTPKIASALIDAGSDVNHKDKTKKKSWNSPVLHDAVSSAVMATSREKHSVIKEMFANVIRLLLEGADPLKRDSRRATAFERYVDAIKTRTKDAYFIEPMSGKPYTHKDHVRRASYLREMYDLLLELGVKPVGASKLTKTQRERAGI